MYIPNFQKNKITYTNFRPKIKTDSETVIVKHSVESTDAELLKSVKREVDSEKIQVEL